MPHADALFADASTPASHATAPLSDAAVMVFKHALKVWAREQGIAEEDLPGLTEVVLEFANSAIRATPRREGADG